MMHLVFDKTDKGREEIATRCFRLPPRLRTLLLLFDGKQTVEQVLAKVSGIGLTEQNVGELVDNGFIVNESYRPAAKPAVAASGSAYDIEAHLQALYKFYSDTIRSAIGLRGYALQLKVERARSVEDFRLIRLDYLAAVRKAQGDEIAHELDQELLQLLGTPGLPKL